MFDWFLRPISGRLDAIEFKLDRILNIGRYEMTVQQDIADALAVVRQDVAAQTTVVQGMSVYVAGIQKQLADLAGQTKDDSTAAALMALAAQIESNTKSDADAMATSLTGVTSAQAGSTEPAPTPEPNPFTPPADAPPAA
jgi:hypothetical protein